jgi:hypothetical protein
LHAEGPEQGTKSDNLLINGVVLKFIGYEWFFHNSPNNHVKPAKIKVEASNFVL